MGNPCPSLIIEIDSDEEDTDSGETREHVDYDSDDVVVVSESIQRPHEKQRSRASHPSLRVVVDDDDDDECVVFEKDPENPAVAADGGDDDSDELEITGEKGEVACRDFPHPRHLCVEFPFASTPHEAHCRHCHCYVCDTIAPCSNWDTGSSGTDHCHATDKKGYWKTERKQRKSCIVQIFPRPTFRRPLH